MMAGVIIRIALRALMRNKGRALLTALGIIIGIAAVIAVIALGHGASSMMKDQISTMGSNLILVYPGSSQVGGFRGGMGTRENLTDQDGLAILRECPLVKAVCPVTHATGQIQFRERDWSTRIEGVGMDYLLVRNWQVEDGDFFTEGDLRRGVRVCVLGATVASELFDERSPVGEYIRVRGVLFRVVGVLSSKGSTAWGRDQDDVLIVPITTSRRVIQRWSVNADSVNQLLVSLKRMDDMPAARTEVTSILRQQHRKKPDDEDDFTVTDMTEVTKMVTQVSGLMTLLLTVIASISLVVGGIGIMNIMLVSVTERTREIGLRLAVGATRKDILWQFLVEAIVLAGLGGVIGVGLGSVVAKMVARANDWPVVIAPGAVLLSLSFAAGVGIFFGFYPAWRAARMNPIESLRHE